MPRIPFLRAVLLLASLTGCPSASVFTSARPIGSYGVSRFGVYVGGQSGATFGGDTVGATVPQFGFVPRIGISSSVDLGIHLGTQGLGGDVKVALLQSPSIDEGIDISIDPTASYAFPRGASAALPILIGINTGGGDQLVIGPRIGAYGFNLSYLGADADIWMLYGGASLGYFAEVSESMTVIPELSVVHPLAFSLHRFPDTSSIPPRTSVEVLRRELNAFTVQFGIAFLFAD